VIHNLCDKKKEFFKKMGLDFVLEHVDEKVDFPRVSYVRYSEFRNVLYGAIYGKEAERARAKHQEATSLQTMMSLFSSFDAKETEQPDTPLATPLATPLEASFARFMNVLTREPPPHQPTLKIPMHSTLELFLNHSDNDGSFSKSECKKLAKLFRTYRRSFIAYAKTRDSFFVELYTSFLRAFQFVSKSASDQAKLVYC
jgi:hypothetical protein